MFTLDLCCQNLGSGLNPEDDSTWNQPLKPNQWHSANTLGCSEWIPAFVFYNSRSPQTCSSWQAAMMGWHWEPHAESDVSFLSQQEGSLLAVFSNCCLGCAARQNECQVFSLCLESSSKPYDSSHNLLSMHQVLTWSFLVLPHEGFSRQMIFWRSANCCNKTPGF